jgi:membrane-bound ClpP family serine protease
MFLESVPDGRRVCRCASSSARSAHPASFRAYNPRIVVAEVVFFVVAAIVLFELVEHVVIPIAAAAAARKRPAVTGAEGMVGKVAVVKLWSEREGQVVVDGEVWKATSNSPLVPGDTATVRSLRGLTLRVTKLDDEECQRARTPLPRL